ncbi:hypothetical protein ASF48_07025 [Rathayibacter sp. Leaf299]|nr:hypothetical protein ASF48_07025 [Rathayibacter sp. Leaf299]
MVPGHEWVLLAQSALDSTDCGCEERGRFLVRLRELGTVGERGLDLLGTHLQVDELGPVFEDEIDGSIFDLLILLCLIVDVECSEEKAVGAGIRGSSGEL